MKRDRPTSDHQNSFGEYILTKMIRKQLKFSGRQAPQWKENQCQFSTSQFQQYGLNYQKAFLASHITWKLIQDFDETQTNYLPLKKVLLQKLEQYPSISEEAKNQIRKLFVSGIQLDQIIFTQKRIQTLKIRQKNKIVFHPTRIVTSQLAKQIIIPQSNHYHIFYGLFGISKTLTVILLHKLLNNIANFRILYQIKRLQESRKEFFYNNKKPIPDHLKPILHLPKLIYVSVNPQDRMGRIIQKIWLQLQNQEKKYMEQRKAFTIKKMAKQYKQLGIVVHVILDRINTIYSKIRKTQYRHIDYFNQYGNLTEQGKRIKEKFKFDKNQKKFIIRQKNAENQQEVNLNINPAQNIIGRKQTGEDFFDDDYQSQKQNQLENNILKMKFQIIHFQQIVYQLSLFSPLFDSLCSINIEQDLKNEIKFCVEESRFDGDMVFSQIQFCEYIPYPLFQSEMVDFFTYEILHHKILQPDVQKKILSSSSFDIDEKSVQLKQFSSNIFNKKLPNLKRLQQILQDEKFQRLNKLLARQKVKRELNNYLSLKLKIKFPSQLENTHQLLQSKQKPNQENYENPPSMITFQSVKRQINKIIDESYNSSYMITPLIISKYFSLENKLKRRTNTQPIHSYLKRLLELIQQFTSKKLMDNLTSFCNSTSGESKDLTLIRKLVIYNIKQHFKTLNFEQVKNLQNIKISLEKDFIIKLSKESKKILKRILDRNSFFYCKQNQSININFPPRFIFKSIIEKNFSQSINQSIASQQAGVLFRNTQTREQIIQFLLINAIKNSKKVQFSTNLSIFNLVKYSGQFISIPKFVRNTKNFNQPYSLVESIQNQIVKLRDYIEKDSKKDSVVMQPVFRSKSNTLIKDFTSKSIDFMILKMIKNKDTNVDKLELNLFDVTVSNNPYYLREKLRNFLTNYNELKDKEKEQIIIDQKPYQISHNFYVIKPKSTENLTLLTFLKDNYKLSPLQNATTQLYSIQHLTLRKIGFLSFEQTILLDDEKRQIPTIFKFLNEQINQQKENLQKQKNRNQFNSNHFQNYKK